MPSVNFARVTFVAGCVAVASGTTCDLYDAGNTPCVAAHSTVRALYMKYGGPLYQVQRASDSRTFDVRPLQPGSVANASSQDEFCGGTTCVFSQIYDQSPMGNHLAVAPGGGAKRQGDVAADANAGPLLVGGTKVYGLRMDPPSGYRNDTTTGIAVGDEAETMYAVFNGSHYNNRQAHSHPPTYLLTSSESSPPGPPNAVVPFQMHGFLGVVVESCPMAMMV